MNYQEFLFRNSNIVENHRKSNARKSSKFVENRKKAQKFLKILVSAHENRRKSLKIIDIYKKNQCKFLENR